MVATSDVTPFARKIGAPLQKSPVNTLQINLGRRCNLACTHCHVEAGPQRTEELSSEVCDRLLELIARFPQIQSVDLTGGAPEMNYGFRPLVEAARARDIEVIVRSNLTIFFEPSFEDLPDYFAAQGVRVVASLPCYLEDNVDKQRGNGVYEKSIRALQQLNARGYGRDFLLDLVYNPPVPVSPDKFMLPPAQAALEADYKRFLKEHFDIAFNSLLTITNLPIGRVRQFMQRQNIEMQYLQYLEANFNAATVPGLMCRNQLSIDYLGNVFDCDFNQMENLPARTADGEVLTVARLLELGSLDAIATIQTKPYCYGCTAGSGSSCGGALV